MSDEQNNNIENEIKIPRATVAVFIFNKKGQLFLMKSPKWNNELVPPGGHIEYGEKIMDAAKREIKEETGLEIENLELLTAIDMIKPSDFIKKDKHFVGLEMRADLAANSPEAVLEKREGVEFFWQEPKEYLQRTDLEPATRKIIEDYLVKEKKSFFAKKCRDCEKMKKECEEYKAGWQRALADYKNLQAEIEKRRGEWATMSEVMVLEEFLPVLENLKKAMSVSLPLPEGEIKRGWEQGIECIIKQFADILKAHGVEEIKTVGEKFDPKLHEAVSAAEPEPNGSVHGSVESGVIVREVSGGYKIGEKVIRVAKVVIWK